MVLKKPSLIRKPLDLCLVLLALLAAIAGWFSFWTESEMWNVVVVKHLFEDVGEYDFSIKPFFNLLLFINFHIAKSLGVHPMDTARILFAINALVVTWLLYRIPLALGHSSRVGALTALLFLSNSFVMKRFFTARSDMVVTTLFLALTWLALDRRWTKFTPRIRYGLFAAVAGISLCFTPKAILIALAWGYAFLLSADRVRTRQVRVMICGALATAFLALVFSPKAFEFFVESFSPHSSGMSYWHPGRWEHFVRLVIENPWIVLVGAASVYASWNRKLKLTPEARSLVRFSNFLWLETLIYPEKLPFYLASQIPFFLVVLPALWKSFRARPVFRLRSRLIVWIAVFAVISVGYWSAFGIVGHSNRAQKAFIGWLSQRADSLRALKIYDPVGILPYMQTVNWFVGPNERGNPQVLKNIQEEKIDLILGTSKLAMMGKGFFDLLQAEYWTSGDGIFVRKHLIVVEERQIPSEKIASLLIEAMPFLKKHPAHKVYLQLTAREDLDLSRYAQWNAQGGVRTPFENSVSLEDLKAREGQYLELPPTAKILALPVRLETPYGPSWVEMFRFDPEY